MFCCMYTCRSEEGIRSIYSWLWAPYGCWELNSRPLEEQPVFLTGFNPSTQEAEAGRSLWALDQKELQSKLQFNQSYRVRPYLKRRGDGCRVDLAQQLRAYAVLAKDPNSLPPHTSNSSQLPVTVASGKLMPLCSLPWQLLTCAHTLTHIHII